MDEYIDIEITAKTVLSIVSGEIKSDRIREVMRTTSEPKISKPARITGDGKVAIPIYGALRGYLEKILREKGENVCDSSVATCGKCVLCDLFGYAIMGERAAPAKRGRAIIDDLKSADDYKKIVHPLVHLKIDRETGKVSSVIGMEEIEEGSVFKGHIRIIDPKPRDLELIIAGLKAIEEFGVGGWITRGRGRLKIEYKIERKRWTDFLERAREEVEKLAL